MRAGRSGRAVAGAFAMLPLGILLVGSWALQPGPDEPAATPPGAGAALVSCVLTIIVTALVTGLGRWVPATASRVVLTICGAGAALGATYLLVSLLSSAPGAGALLAGISALAWGRLVFGLHGAQRPSRAEVLARIPERDRVVPGPRVSGAAPGSPVGFSGQGHGDSVLWRTGVQSWRMRWLAGFEGLVLAGVVAVSSGSAAGWATALLVVLGVAGCAVIWFWSRIEVRIDTGGLSIVSEPIGVPLLRVAPEEVLGVASAQIDPMVWGGWGLRWTGRHTAFVVAGGPGLVVYRASGRPLALEIPAGSETAEDGAALLRAVAGAS